MIHNNMTVLKLSNYNVFMWDWLVLRLMKANKSLVDEGRIDNMFKLVFTFR